MNMNKTLSKMKVVILAAGNATRCQPLSSMYNKPMLPILGTPLIGRIIQTFREIGIEHFFVVYGDKEHQIIPYLESISSTDQITITMIKQPKAMGMADAVLLVQKQLFSSNASKDLPFIITAGDALFSSKQILNMVISHSNNYSIATLGIFYSSDPIMGTRYANIEHNKANLVSKIIEKPGEHNLISQLFSMPLFIFSPQMFSFLEKVPLSSRGEREIQDSIQKAINSGASVHSSMILPHSINSFQDGQYHLTYPRDFLSMNWRILKEKPPKQQPQKPSMIPPFAGSLTNLGANTTIGPNVYLSVNTKIKNNCKIQNTYFFPNSRIEEKCILSNCIIGEEVKISPSTIEDSKIFLISGVYPLK
ncbi:MAG: putative UTP--glucose-1-phosphate uridylyltransferase AglF [Promethearchaeota archaeon]|nr:MAG: putative UTP--glucose-1-phosphate uridylyltransferase AglF [Candidatus Lokiarchaeota archaeon]